MSNYQGSAIDWAVVLRAVMFAMLVSNNVPAIAGTPTVLITMDDMAAQPIHGLMHPEGLTFGFTVNGVADNDATYASGGPGSTAFIQDPSIEGTTAGVVSLTFDQPSTLLEFGLAVNEMGVSVPNGLSVELFTPLGVSLGEGLFDLVPTTGDISDAFAEARFTYSGPAIQSATIGFPVPMDEVERFAFDNLRFNRVPEPASAVLVAMSLFAVVAVRWRNQCQAPY